jgi:hypothetical protein
MDAPEPTLAPDEVCLRVYRNPDGDWVAVVRVPGQRVDEHRIYFEEVQ